MMRRLMRLEFEVPVHCRELIIIALSYRRGYAVPVGRRQQRYVAFADQD
jgi:hypothetical protein